MVYTPVMDKYFDPDLPVVVGFVGQRATGKTATANGLAPPARMVGGKRNEPRVIWDHLYYALPLYRMATARQSIEGEQVYDRVAYEVHATLVDAFGSNPLYGAPSYNDLVQMVYEITEYPCPREGKPRAFLQFVGTDLCRKYDPDVWVKWMDRKIKEEHRHFLMEYPEPDEDTDDIRPYYGVVVSDCRFENEAKLIKDHPNGILLKLTASPDVIAEREFNRDGVYMTDEQKKHLSETSVNLIPDEWYDEIINTDNYTIADQVAHVKQLVTKFTGATHA